MIKKEFVGKHENCKCWDQTADVCSHSMQCMIVQYDQAMCAGFKLLSTFSVLFILHFTVPGLAAL